MFNVWLRLRCTSKEYEGEIVEYSGTVEFYCNEEGYGNGYGMFIKMKDEPFSGQGYDIRYNRDFNPNNKIEFILSWYANKYDGQKGYAKLLGIKVEEIEETTIN